MEVDFCQLRNNSFQVVVSKTKRKNGKTQAEKPQTTPKCTRQAKN